MTKLFANELTVENVTIYEDARHQMLIVDSPENGQKAFELRCGMWMATDSSEYLEGYLAQAFPGRLDFV